MVDKQIKASLIQQLQAFPKSAVPAAITPSKELHRHTLALLAKVSG